MALDPTARKALYILGGMAVLAAIPIATRLGDKRVEAPVHRLEREKREAKDAVAALAKQSLACEEIEVREPAGELWAHGCGKKARYMPTTSGAYALAGAVEPDTEDACAVKWRADAGTSAADADAGAEARAAADAVRAVRRPARVRIPVTAFGVTGLAKLRYGELVDVILDAHADALGDAVPVPCLDPPADGGVREGRCTLPWSAVVEVAECR